MFPVRCYTCNTVIAHLHPAYVAAQRSEGNLAEALRALGVQRMCCRRMFLGYVDLTADQLEHGNVDVSLDEGGTVLRRLSVQAHDAPCA